MNTLTSHYDPSSTTPSILDLDGYSFRDHGFPMGSSYMPVNQDEFGSDPADRSNTRTGVLYSYDLLSHHNDLGHGSWPGFAHEVDSIGFGQQFVVDSYSGPPTQDPDELIPRNLLCIPTAISRSGQLTPPRSNSICSIDGADRSKKDAFPENAGTKCRHRPKPQPKGFKTTTSKSCGRTRRCAGKVTDSMKTIVDPRDSKRKLGLERNRLAAAKCRSNKKQYVEELQHRSHEKAGHNAYLKEEVMRMKEFVQQISATLLQHAAHDSCKSRGEILNHLSQFEQDSLVGHSSPPGHKS